MIYLIFLSESYTSRSDAVYKKVDLFKIGRALYHINKRRGFQSNRKTDKSSDTGVLFTGKDGKSGIDETSKAIKDGNFKTLGDYLNSLNPHEKRQRNRYTLRAMYINEFKTLMKTQSSFYPDLLDEKLISDLYDAIFSTKIKESETYRKAVYL